jgi:hypothetical protein
MSHRRMNSASTPDLPTLPDSPRPMGGLLTKKELALELRCSERTLERLTLARKLPYLKFGAKMIRYRRDSVFRALVKMETEAIG